MRLNSDELHALLAITLLTRRGSYVLRSALRQNSTIFHRPKNCDTALSALAKANLIEFDKTGDKLHVNEKLVVQFLDLDHSEVQRDLLPPDPFALAHAEVNAVSNSADPPAHSAPPNVHVSETFNRFNVQTNKRSTLRERVRAFVGPDDFARHWDKAAYLWDDPVRLNLLEGDLNVVEAGIRTGETPTKTTRAKHLWATHRRAWSAHLAKTV